MRISLFLDLIKIGVLVKRNYSTVALHDYDQNDQLLVCKTTTLTQMSQRQEICHGSKCCQANALAASALRKSNSHGLTFQQNARVEYLYADMGVSEKRRVLCIRVDNDLQARRTRC